MIRPPMQVPVIAPGKRFTLPRPIGSADALLLARFAQAQAAQKKLLAIVSAEPADTQRLEGELAFFAPELRIAVFPDWETLPYDTFSPHQDLISERLATLWRVRQGEVDVVLLPASTALVRLAPPSFLAAYTFQFKQKQRLDEAALKAQLTLAGYTHVSQVVSPGEYAVRGGLIDLFPMGSPVPYRVDLFGDEVDSIRTFDPDSQRSLYPVPEVRLLPGREFPMDEEARAAFRARWREKLEGDPTKVRLYKDMASGIATAGIEYYLPLFFEQTATIFDYLGEAATLALHGEVDEALMRFWADTRERHRFLQHDKDKPILPPEEIFLRSEDFFARANAHATLALRGAEPVEWARPLPDLSVDRGAPEPLARLHKHVQSTPHRVLIVAESEPEWRGTTTAAVRGMNPRSAAMWPRGRSGPSSIASWWTSPRVSAPPPSWDSRPASRSGSRPPRCSASAARTGRAPPPARPPASACRWCSPVSPRRRWRR